MKSNSQNQPSRACSLLNLSDEFLCLALALRDGRGLGPLDDVRHRLNTCLADLENAGLDAGLPRETLTGLKYPLVAFVDEIILNSSWEHTEAWRDQPLQLAFFNERMAGSGFFDRLESLRQDPAKYTELLDVYHVVLSLGFHGKFRITGQEPLQRLIAELRKQLGYGHDTSDTKLSPHGKQRDTFVAGRAAGLPYWRMAAIAAGVLVVLFAIFFFWINYSATEAVDMLPKPDY